VLTAAQAPMPAVAGMTWCAHGQRSNQYGGSVPGA
jgi:hypothetical protein